MIVPNIVDWVEIFPPQPDVQERILKGDSIHPIRTDLRGILLHPKCDWPEQTLMSSEHTEHRQHD